MELIILYGPPAVGKLTIAEALAEKIGYTIFQNNPTVKAVEPLFEFGSKAFFSALARMRYILFEEAAKANVPGLIFTFCFDPRFDEEFISEAISIVERAGGTVRLFHLIAPEETLLSRVENESRRPHNKVLSREKLKASLQEYDFFTSYPGRRSVAIDTSILSAQEAAEKISRSL